MKRVLWGEFENDPKRGPMKPDEIILPSQKAEQLKKMREAADLEEPKNKVEPIKMQNPLITQTIEVMNQTEMLHTLIDTYANKSGCGNYLLNPCQVIPQVDFPPENSANLIQNDKFAQPLWFIPPIETDFSRGVPQKFPRITGKIAKTALRKSISGLARVAGYSEASENTLILFTDAVEQYIRSLLRSMKHVQALQSKDKSNILDIDIMEKGYYAVTHNSLLTLHDYYKTEVIGRNISEINEFKEVYNEYDKLRKESQNAQKTEFKEEDYMNFLDFPGIMQTTNSQQADGVNLMQFIDGESGVLDYFGKTEMGEASNTDDQINRGASTSTLE